MKPIHILGFAVSAALLSARGETVEKTIPLEKEEKPQVALVAFRQPGLSVTIDPTTAASQQNSGSITNSLQQQMRLTMEQALAPWLSLAYGAGIGFRTEEIQLIRQEDQTAAWLSMLNRPALNWKPQENVSVEVAYETRQSLNNEFATDHTGTTAVQGKIQVTPGSTLGVAYTNQERTAGNGDRSAFESARLTSSHDLAEFPVTLQFNPGAEKTTSANGTQAIRAFVENAVIWKVDGNTTLTVGSGLAGGRNSALSESGYLLVQHVVLPGTALELRAAMLNADQDLPGEGFAVSAGSSIALAQALSAGLNVRYRMDENATLDRPKNETFLSLSVNGRF